MKLSDLLSLACRTPNRGRCHVFLGHPLSDGCDKTTVEPGNVFSPGVWTCGVSLWVLADGRAHAAQLLEDDEVSWHFGDGPDGLPPVLTSTWPAGPLTVRIRLAHRGGPGAEGCDFLSAELTASAPCRATAAVIIQDVGPAGGLVRSIRPVEENGVATDSGLVVRLCGRPCQRLIHEPPEPGQSAAAALACELDLQPGRPERLDFVAEHGFEDRPFAGSLPRRRPFSGESVEAAFRHACQDWQAALPARVFAPDPRVAAAWERSAFHILCAMECGLPHIGAVNYPIFWTRDCVMVLRALDLMGRPDLARIGCEYLAPLYFSGGFGAESDGPGQGIWALARHARISGDRQWLRQVYEHISSRARLLMQMRRAAEPMRRLTENRTPAAQRTPASSVLCLPAQDGLIRGRMDWHSPDFYINCWGAAGMREAAWAAAQLGIAADASTFAQEAQDWAAAIRARLLPRYGNERDPAAAPHPTGFLDEEPEALRPHFARWYRSHRLGPDGHRRPEQLWTYFETAQIHNAVLLGLRDDAWRCLDGLLEDARRPYGVAAWREGSPGGPECLPFRNDLGARGWLDPQRAMAGNMPHNWTSAEVICLLRTVFVREEKDSLVLGSGVPEAWLRPGSRFGVRQMPTDRGKVSYTVTVDAAGRAHLDYEGPRPFRLDWPQPN